MTRTPLEDLDKKYAPLFEKSENLLFKSVNSVNHQPHQLSIGPKHVTYAADHNGGMLTAEIARKVGCAHPGCHTDYDSHTWDTVLFLQLKREAKKEDVQAELKIAGADMNKDGIDGVCFVDTTEKFRII